ncbi:hypothetical protein GQ85_43830, partial [Rhodococcus rhodochrous]
LATAADPSLDADTVRVVLTADYAGPGTDANVTSVASGSDLVSAGATPTSVPAAPPIDAAPPAPAA